MEYTTMKRNGGWTVELSTPIDKLDKIDLAPVKLDHTIRWARGDIPSVLALISELSGVSESSLKQLSGQDTDRLFVAFSFIATGSIKDDFQKGARPLATPPELMSDEERYRAADEQNDEIDPRFPKVNEPVQRFRKEPEMTAEASPQPQPDAGLSIDAPPIMQKVG